MKSRVIHTKIWTDSWFHDLKNDEQLFFLYLLTNEYCNVLDIYELPMSIASYQTGISKDRINQIKATFKEAKKIDYINDYVLLSNSYKYQFYKGAKNNYAKLRIIFEMSDDVIKHFDKHIAITLSQIANECKQFSVTSADLLNLFQRVKQRLELLNITLSVYPYADTPQKSEIINHKSESKRLVNLTTTPEYQKLISSVRMKS